MVSMDDAKFMFYVTSLFRKNSGEESILLHRLLREIDWRDAISYVQPNIIIPTSAKDANKRCLKGEHAIIDLMPHPKLHMIAGHPCYRIDDVMLMHMALQRSVESAEIPRPEQT